MILNVPRSAPVFVLILQGYLLYRDTSNHTMSAIKINPETLEPEGTVIMPGTKKTIMSLFNKVSLGAKVFKIQSNKILTVVIFTSWQVNIQMGRILSSQTEST